MPGTNCRRPVHAPGQVPGHDLSRGHYSPLYAAAFHGHAGVVAVLLAAGADVDPQRGGSANSHSPLYAAAAKGYPEVVAALLAAGPQVLARAVAGGEEAVAAGV